MKPAKKMVNGYFLVDRAQYSMNLARGPVLPVVARLFRSGSRFLTQRPPEALMALEVDHVSDGC